MVEVVPVGSMVWVHPTADRETKTVRQRAAEITIIERDLSF